MPEFIFSNEEYDDDQIEQIRNSSRLARSQATETPDFVFVNASHGDDEESKKDTRKVVRSRATAYSHRVAPRGALKPEVMLRVIRRTEDADSPSSRRHSTASLASTESARNRKSRKRAKHSPQPGPSSTATGPANISRKRARLPIKREPSSDTDRSRHALSTARRSRSISPGAFRYELPDPLFMDASMRDPFSSYPVRYRDWYGQLISFWYNVVFARSTRVLKATKAELDAYTVWSRRQELQEPALFYCALFLASGIPVAEGLFPVEAALWLRYKTVEAMKEALADPKRALSNPVILAVGRIALHEHIYGNRELAHNVHRPAQLRMVNLRGGLINMGLPATTIQLIVWTDALLSAEAGTPAYFAHVPEQLAIKSYSPQEAMHVTNHCSPKRNAHPGYGKAGNGFKPEYED